MARWPATPGANDAANLQNSRKGNRQDDTQQAKERPTNQICDQHYDGMQPRFSPHDAWTQIHPFEQLPANKQDQAQYQIPRIMPNQRQAGLEHIGREDPLPRQLHVNTAGGSLREVGVSSLETG